MFIGRKASVSKAFRVVFHNETKGLGMHGALRVSHIDHRIDYGIIRFTFMGLKKPPQLTPEIINFIWSSAEDCGYVVHALEKYSAVMEHVQAQSVTEVLSESRKRSESSVTGWHDLLPIHHEVTPNKSKLVSVNN